MTYVYDDVTYDVLRERCAVRELRGESGMRGQSARRRAERERERERERGDLRASIHVTTLVHRKR